MNLYGFPPDELNNESVNLTYRSVLAWYQSADSIETANDEQLLVAMTRQLKNCHPYSAATYLARIHAREHGGS